MQYSGLEKMPEEQILREAGVRDGGEEGRGGEGKHKAVKEE